MAQFCFGTRGIHVFWFLGHKMSSLTLVFPSVITVFLIILKELFFKRHFEFKTGTQVHNTAQVRILECLGKS